MLLQVIEHQRVCIFKHLLEGFKGQEDLVDGIGCRIAEVVALRFVVLYLLFDDGRYHIVFIGKELVDRLFGNAQLRGYLVHRDGADTIAAEEIGGLCEYSFFYIHIG